MTRSDATTAASEAAQRTVSTGSNANSANDWLGPATVVGGSARSPLVELQDASGRRVAVTPAFTFPYEPTTDDVLLVLGQDDGWFAVGVIQGSRPTQLHFPGDASIHATNGRLTLSSDRAVEVRSPRVTVRAGVLRTIAESMVEKTDRLRRWVRGLLAVRAGTSNRIVDGEDSTRCENSTTLAKDTVKIDGDQLHLGH